MLHKVATPQSPHITRPTVDLCACINVVTDLDPPKITERKVTCNIMKMQEMTNL